MREQSKSSHQAKMSFEKEKDRRCFSLSANGRGRGRMLELFRLFDECILSVCVEILFFAYLNVKEEMRA